MSDGTSVADLIQQLRDAGFVQINGVWTWIGYGLGTTYELKLRATDAATVSAALDVVRQAQRAGGFRCAAIDFFGDWSC
jgi:hypothetical protein